MNKPILFDQITVYPYSTVMVGTVEVHVAGGKCRWLNQEPHRGETAPVCLRSGEVIWVQWGGMMPLTQARSQALGRPVRIPITAWAASHPRYGWEFAAETDYLHGCLVRSVKRKLLVVFGVFLNGKPKLVQGDVKPTIPTPEKKIVCDNEIPLPASDELKEFLAIGWLEGKDSNGSPVLRWPGVRGLPQYPGKAEEPVFIPPAELADLPWVGKKRYTRRR